MFTVFVANWVITEQINWKHEMLVFSAGENAQRVEFAVFAIK